MISINNVSYLLSCLPDRFDLINNYSHSSLGLAPFSNCFIAERKNSSHTCDFLFGLHETSTMSTVSLPAIYLLKERSNILK